MNNNLHDVKTFLCDTASDIVQALPDINVWPGAVLYFLKVLEVKAKDLDPRLPRGFENALRIIITG